MEIELLRLGVISAIHGVQVTLGTLWGCDILCYEVRSGSVWKSLDEDGIHTRLDRKIRGEKGSQGEKGTQITPSSKIRHTTVKKRMKKGSDRKFSRYVETSYKEEKLHFSAKSFRKVFGNVRKCRKCDAQKRTLTKFGVFSQILIGIPSGFEAFCHFCEICMFF